jgi:tRNA(Ile)-lysidine synthetase-like protein
LVQQKNADIVVAHFDHGIRENSGEDEQFVRSLAASYGVPYVSERRALGARASEATARQHRYDFLQRQAALHDATIVTAHHLDDLVETIAINLHRGTGWRGLAVFGANIERPLLHWQKDELISYARHTQLQWREDPTNSSDAYLRNRIRKKALALNADQKRQLHALQATQTALRKEIDKEVSALVGTGPRYRRYIFISLPASVALECLRAITGGLLTRPQAQRLLHAIKTAPSGKTYEASKAIKVQFSARYFTV